MAVLQCPERTEPRRSSAAVALRAPARPRPPTRPRPGAGISCHVRSPAAAKPAGQRLAAAARGRQSVKPKRRIRTLLSKPLARISTAAAPTALATQRRLPAHAPQRASTPTARRQYHYARVPALSRPSLVPMSMSLLDTGSRSVAGISPAVPSTGRDTCRRRISAPTASFNVSVCFNSDRMCLSNSRASSNASSAAVVMSSSVDRTVRMRSVSPTSSSCSPDEPAVLVSRTAPLSRRPRDDPAVTPAGGAPFLGEFFLTRLRFCGSAWMLTAWCTVEATARSPVCSAYSTAKLAPITVIGSASMRMPACIKMAATILPAVEVGTISPYPRVVDVTSTHQNVAGIEWNGDSSMSRPILSHRKKRSVDGSYSPLSSVKTMAPKSTMPRKVKKRSRYKASALV
mmetsp:Transcript_25102/g.87563  ORF Transcript_25102/g.87563 Transcript_25102/m.87563 type:complete len:400 (+) Transcript_25102:71-1270(+)